ncbi:hypothetical protein [Chryseobacterium indologenes]|uniref:hypothetical protein n=1 Tax=Chryseobacterium indologenes TaxID=253 RepID=UPI00405825D3
MTISEIAAQINELTSENDTPFSNLQKIRYERLKSRPNTWQIFSSKSIKSDYAYHSGGRAEFQFNIGDDWILDSTVFRYGLAFSLHRDQTVSDPETEFAPQIDRLNNFILSNPNYFEGFSMWYYSPNDLEDFFIDVRPIDDVMAAAGNFIFIGKFFTKGHDQINVNDIWEIINCFDNLIELYEKVTFGDIVIEKRFARLTWNTNGWVKPSGPLGKSKNKDTHEGKYGYGHEEWLFDTSKLIDGYHYGFLEPIRKQQQAFTDNQYNVWLYTINNYTKKRYYIGEIDNVEVLSIEEAEEIKQIYIDRHWHAEMQKQIRESGANSDGFSNWKGVDLFNIRFLPEKLRFNADYFELPKNSKVQSLSRYTFGKFTEDLTPELIAKGFEFPFLSVSDGFLDDEADNEKIETITYERVAKPIEVQYVHKAISKRLKSSLIKMYGVENVQDELPAGYGNNKIDMVVKIDDHYVFYEIKSYNSSRTSIREALGQLLEYSCWVDNINANKLVIVSQKLGDTEDAIKYINHLRDNFNLPIYFQTFDLDSEELSNEF